MYGWRGAVKTVDDRPLLRDPAGVHHQHPVARLGDHREVVGDQDQRQPEVLPEPLEELEDLRLDHDVERGRRLVADDDRRIAGEGHRDHRALAHAAGQLVRVRAGALARDADEVQQLHGARRRRLLGLVEPVARAARRSGRGPGAPG